MTYLVCIVFVLCIMVTMRVHHEMEQMETQINPDLQLRQRQNDIVDKLYIAHKRRQHRNALNDPSLEPSIAYYNDPLVNLPYDKEIQDALKSERLYEEKIKHILNQRELPQSK